VRAHDHELSQEQYRQPMSTPATGRRNRALRWLTSSLSRRVTAFALAFLVVMAGGVGWLSYQANRGLAEAGALKELAGEAALAASRVELKLSTLLAELARLSANPMIVRGLEDKTAGEAYLGPFFRGYQPPGRMTATLSLHDAQGRPLAASGAASPPSYENTPLLKRVIGLGFAHAELVAAGRTRELVLARPVQSATTGRPGGMLVMHASLNELFGKAVGGLNGDTAKRLKSERGEVYAEVGGRPFADALAATHPLSIDASQFPYRLHLEVAGERAALLAPLEQLAHAYAVGAGLVLLLVAWFLHRLARHLSGSLAPLARAATTVAAGGAIAAPLPVKGEDDVAALARAFNTMAARLNDSQQEVETRVVERTAMLEDINSALVKEILSHKQTGQQLHVAANAIENAAEGVMICDGGGRIVSVNKAFTRITGYAPEEVLGRTPESLLSAERAAAVRDEIARAIAEHGHWKGELESRRKDGDTFIEERSVSAVKDEEGNIVNYIVLFSDVTKQKQDEQRIQYLAHHDPLTGLANRTLFQQRCDDALARANRRNGKVAVMFIDLDHFKTVNDSLGHAYGDELLKNVSARLQECVRKTDTVARQGGDEFTVLLTEVGDSGDVAFISKKIIERLTESFTVAGHEIYVSASIGISFYPDDGQNAAALIKNADAAMYAAKEQGRNNYQFFSAEMNAQALEALMMASSLRLAIERSELVLEYQPRIDLRSGEIMGAEALVRWNHPNLGRIMPGQFIGIAEKTGLIDPLGEWVLRQACRQMIEWDRQGISPHRVAVNLSARQFRQPDLTERIAAIIEETGIAGAALEVEVTESMVMHDPQRAAVVLERLKEMGVAVAIDDFGTGYSSLSYLKRFPIDYIKIDQSFIRGIPLDAEDVGITRAIVALAKTLDVKLIAEGVDNTEQLAFLRREGCDEGQGYFISSSLSADALGKFISSAAEPGSHLHRTRAALRSLAAG
jgi:diguanylate cyclase (GGDEF)-like protein/PAS domain S-box-containing protein